jgi:hypothetical protein
MCASCGCGKPNEQHGDSRHITMDQIQQAAAAAKISPLEVTKNMADSARAMSGAATGNQGSSMSASSSPSS